MELVISIIIIDIMIFSIYEMVKEYRMSQTIHEKNIGLDICDNFILLNGSFLFRFFQYSKQIWLE